jgi:phytoene synthase
MTVLGTREPPDVQVARTVTQAKATTFALACRLLPESIRDDVYRLYLVFRTLDDLVDDGDVRARERVAAVKAWALDDGASPTDEVAALSLLASRWPISRRAIADFCVGMEQDLDGAGLLTERDVDRYCYRVAGTVGVAMCGLLGAQGPDALACATALGMAMQRTNILRDIDEDAAVGRVYVSEEARRTYGRSLEPGRRAALVHAQVLRADDLYVEGLAGVRTLCDGQLAIRLAALLYREILHEVERRENAGRSGRAVVSDRRKLALAARFAFTAG